AERLETAPADVRALMQREPVAELEAAPVRECDIGELLPFNTQPDDALRTLERLQNGADGSYGPVQAFAGATEIQVCASAPRRALSLCAAIFGRVHALLVVRRNRNGFWLRFRWWRLRCGDRARQFFFWGNSRQVRFRHDLRRVVLRLPRRKRSSGLSGASARL